MHEVLIGTEHDVHAQVVDLVEGGEANLLRAEAGRRFELHTHQVRRGAIDLVITELSQLHAQLNSITTQCTLIIGFGLASIGADTLSVLASDEDQFCIYKTLRARALGTAYILLTTVCICMCMSVITTAQIITFRSTRASFTYPETKHIVEMTSILMHGDHRSKRDTEKIGRPRIHRPFTIYSTFMVALVCFFFCTVLVVWIFLGTNNWVPLKEGAAGAHIREPPSNDTYWNDYVRYNSEGYMVKCSNPYNHDETIDNDFFSTAVAWAHTGTFILCVLFGARQARFVSKQFEPETLQMHFTPHPRAGSGSMTSRTPTSSSVRELGLPLDEGATAHV
ncbi:hypothetical protein AB1Y20_002322 [Prymnesium parvum]|uniref:Uncharacterized protein n=1 Tax=Prymnesium parvum TaxID=97485 RepID=A0AB34JAL0_PRYPA